MMAEIVGGVDGDTISSLELGSAQYSPEFKDPLGVNDRLCAAVDDESDEFDFDVSFRLTDVIPSRYCFCIFIPVND